MSETKTCAKCHEEQRLSEFSFAPAARDKRDSWCKACHREYGLHRKSKERGEFYENYATYDEVRLFVEGLNLGFSMPKRGARGPKSEALIKRYNREHPDRPYLPVSERASAYSAS